MGAALGFPHTCFLPQCSELTVPSVFQVKQDGPLLGCKDRKPLKCCVPSQRCLMHPGLECHVGPTRISTRQVLLCSMLLGSGSSNPDGVLGQAGGAAVVLCAVTFQSGTCGGQGLFLRTTLISQFLPVPQRIPPQSKWGRKISQEETHGLDLFNHIYLLT